MLNEWLNKKKRGFYGWLEDSSMAAKGGAILAIGTLIALIFVVPIEAILAILGVIIVCWLLFAFLFSVLN